MNKVSASASLLAIACATVAIAQTGEDSSQQQTAPDAPQYQSGTTEIPSSPYAPTGTTTGTALNGNTQVTIPTSEDTYVYGQNASQEPSPSQPNGSMGATVGGGMTFP
jgi:hypothetical protein